mgnify:CR=1 FL=1
MEIRHFRFHVGLPREVRLLHTTDNHLCLADERDGARKITLAKNRAEAFGASADVLCERFRASVAYAKANRLLYLSMGDILDFVSLANLEFARQTLEGCDYLMAAHEDKIACYHAHRYRQQKADAATLAFVDFAAHDPSVCGVIAGHCHQPFADTLSWYREVPMLVSGAGCNGCATEIIVD